MVLSETSKSIGLELTQFIHPDLRLVEQIISSHRNVYATGENGILKTIGSSREIIQNKMGKNLKPETLRFPEIIISANVELKDIYSRAANVVGKIISRN